MMVRFVYSIVILFCAIGIADAKVNFKDVKFKKSNRKLGQVEALFDNEIVEIPQLKFEDRKIVLHIPQVTTSSKIAKKISLEGNSDMLIVGEQISKKDSRLSISLPYSIKKIKDKINVSLKGKKVFLDFPLLKSNVKKTTNRFNSKDNYDESYLQNLINEKNVKDSVKKEKKVESDVVRSSFSSSPKEKENFFLGKQIGKFIVFLALVIAIFYGIVLFIKKSILSKNKLGFLNSTKMVEVLNTTYVAPKRSIMIVRIHKQIFLIGSSEKGFHSLGELTDVAGLLKDGEVAVSGNNFDLSLQSALKTEQKLSLKEMAKAEVPKKQEGSSRLSDQIKNKIKGLKSLQ